jgi:hypothetical protein
VKVRKKSPTWWGRYTDGAGQRHQVKLSASKETARRMLAKIAGDAQLAGVGIANPFEEQLARPLVEHARDFGRYLEAKGDTKGHADRQVSRCLKVLEGIQADDFADLQPSAVLEFLAGLRAPGRERVELDSAKELYTKSELLAVLGINRGSVARMLHRKNLEGQGKGRARRYPRGVMLQLQEALCRGRGWRPRTTTSLRSRGSRAGW